MCKQLLQEMQLLVKQEHKYDKHFFFYLGFFPRTFTIHRTTGEGEGGWRYSLSPLYHFHPAHRHLYISRAINVVSSPLHIASNRTRNGKLWPKILRPKSILRVVRLWRPQREGGRVTKFWEILQMVGHGFGLFSFILFFKGEWGCGGMEFFSDAGDVTWTKSKALSSTKFKVFYIFLTLNCYTTSFLKFL